MDMMSIVEDTELTRFCPQTDRQTDGRTDKVKPVYPPFNFVEAGGIITSQNTQQRRNRCITLSIYSRYYITLTRLSSTDEIEKKNNDNLILCEVHLTWKKEDTKDMSNHFHHVSYINISVKMGHIKIHLAFHPMIDTSKQKLLIWLFNDHSRHWRLLIWQFQWLQWS